MIAQVADEGVGMSEEVRAHLSEPFFTTKGEGGTGLGLSVAHKVIEQHNGSIDFDSTPEVGTTVTVTLPTHQQQPDRQRHSAPTVMIVDDQEGMRRVTRDILETDGYAVQCASSAEEAIQTFEETINGSDDRIPGVVISDLMMPGMHGTELAHRIKQLAPETRVIILSAFVDEIEPEALEIADVVLHKPCDLQDLSRIVGDLLADGEPV